MATKVTKDELLNFMREAARKSAGPYLTHERFKKISNVSASAIHEHFDTWRAACVAAGIQAGDNGPGNLTPNFSKGRDFAIQQLRKVATFLDTTSLSKSDFDAHATELRAATVQRMFGGWQNALDAASLEAHPLTRQPIDIKRLASELLTCVREIGSVPTVVQITRRSTHGKNTFTRKFGSFSAFKQKAISFLLVHRTDLTQEEQLILRQYLGAAPIIDSEPSGDQASSVEAGHVYLMRSGEFHKIGRTNLLGRREYELAIQLPDKLEKIHVIKTDDARGIEAYWHHRFRAKRRNGEWFKLAPEDVGAFKRRKFM